MGYYIRVLGTTDIVVKIDELIESLNTVNLSADFSLAENENNENWTELIVSKDNNELFIIERNIVKDGELGKDEIEEFKEEIEDCKPLSAVKWLNNYFDKVKVIYAFQLLDKAFEDDNFEIVSNLREKIWNKVDGILQADNEGFSNEDGNHILWQFSDTVTGDWNMAVKNIFGKWTTFTMDLGDIKQREEFWAGKVPKNANKN